MQIHLFHSQPIYLEKHIQIGQTIQNQLQIYSWWKYFLLNHFPEYIHILANLLSWSMVDIWIKISIFGKENDSYYRLNGVNNLMG